MWTTMDRSSDHATSIRASPKLRDLMDRTDVFLDKLLANYTFTGTNEEDDILEDVMDFLSEVRESAAVLDP